MNGRTQVFSERFRFRETNMRLSFELEGAGRTAKKAVLSARIELEEYIAAHPEFRFQLETERLDEDAPEFVQRMMLAGIRAGVGPMAAVAGGLSQVAVEAIVRAGGHYAIAENGGDIFLQSEKTKVIGLSAGASPLSGRIGLRIFPDETPAGICTSAGNLGHSISFGRADAVAAFSDSGFLSDAAATAIANEVYGEKEGAVQRALERAEDIEGLRGCLVLVGGLVGKTGRVPEIVEIEGFTTSSSA